MNDVLRKRLLRILDNLPEERAHQAIEYLEFLEARYGTGANPASPLQRIAEGVEDTLRATRVPGAVIKGTMNAVDAASRVMAGLAAASRAAVDEIQKAASGAAPGPADTEKREPTVSA
ncbi:MAG TPA: hypothetical protein VD793_07560 [Gemmatimonadales bacterium]|nr:hypothetical protein [Gemmatimonadales bacterium]